MPYTSLFNAPIFVAISTVLNIPDTPVYGVATHL